MQKLEAVPMNEENPYLYGKFALKGGHTVHGVLIADTDIAVVLNEPSDLFADYEQRTLAALRLAENARLVREGLQSGLQVDIPIGALGNMPWFAHGSVSENKSGQIIYHLHYLMV